MFIVPICTVSVNFRCKPFPYNAESFSLLYYINKKTHLTRCDLVCFAGPRFKSTTSGFTKKLFCLPRPQWNVPALYFADGSLESACRFSLTRCDLICFAGPHLKSATSGFTKKLFCLPQFDLVRKIALLLGCEQSLPRKKPKSFVRPSSFLCAPTFLSAPRFAFCPCPP